MFIILLVNIAIDKFVTYIPTRLSFQPSSSGVTGKHAGLDSHSLISNPVEVTFFQLLSDLHATETFSLITC